MVPMFSVSLQGVNITLIYQKYNNLKVTDFLSLSLTPLCIISLSDCLLHAFSNINSLAFSCIFFFPVWFEVLSLF